MRKAMITELILVMVFSKSMMIEEDFVIMVLIFLAFCYAKICHAKIE
jgi:hypothetical protein